MRLRLIGAFVAIASGIVGISPSSVAVAADDGCVDSIHGDLDGDSIADTVVADPAASVDGIASAGRLVIVYGQSSGYLPQRTEVLHQGDGLVPGSPRARNEFGAVLEVGEVDADECSDVIIGMPGARVGGFAGAGAVLVIFGAEGGPGRGRPPLKITENSPGFPGEPEVGDRFGESISLTSGVPINAPALAIGAPHEDVDAAVDAGAVSYLELGDDGSPQAGSIRLITEDLDGLDASPHEGDEFGTTLGIGNLDTGLDPSLFVGSPQVDVGGAINAGALDVIVDLRPGEMPTGVRWTQDDLGVEGDPAEVDDHFGAALGYAGGEYTSYGELAVSAPGEDLERKNTGRVYVFDTIIGKLPTTDGLRVLDQSDEDSGDRQERGDRFGAAMAMFPWSVTRSQHKLVIGVPGEDVRGVKNAGMVQRLSVEIGTVWSKPTHQGVPGVPGKLGEDERLGATLGGLQYSSLDAVGSLLIGLPNDVEHPEGAVLVIPFYIAADDPDQPYYDPRIWVPGEGAFPLGGSAFGASATSWDTQYR